MIDTNVGVAVPSTYFGMTYVGGSEPSASDISFGVFGKQPATSWQYIEPTTRGVRDWSVLDGQAALAVSMGVKITYFFQGTPGWAVADHTAGTGAINAITGEWVSTFPPDSETDLINFIDAVIARYGSTIQAYGTWIEPGSIAIPSATVVYYGNRVHDRVRLNAPAAVLLSPTLTPGTTAPGQYYDLLLAGGFPLDFDAVAMHLYPAVATPSQATDFYSRFYGILPLVRKFGLTSKPFWDAESSWGGDATQPDAAGKAAFVSQWLLLRWAFGFTEAHWYGYSGMTFGSLYAAGVLNEGGQAWNRTRGWMLGSTLLQPAFPQGDVWPAWWQMANGKIALSVFNKSGVMDLILPNTITWERYTDLDGNVVTMTSNVVPISTKPIWVEGVSSGERHTAPGTYTP